MEATCSAMSELMAMTMKMQGEADIWQTSTSNTVRPDLGQPSLFRLDGQVILPPLMTSAKKREAQLARQQAMQLEEQRSSSHNMASPQSGLSQTQTYIYDSTRQSQQQRRRPQTLGFDVPTIQVNPPTPLQALPVSPERRLKPNKITQRIQQFEQSVGGHLGQILRSSTSPSLAELQNRPQEAPEAEIEAKPAAESVVLQRSSSFTLDKPSPALVETMRRQGYSPNFQRETIESQAKRVVRQPSPTSNTSSTCSRKELDRERDIERMIELVMNKYGLVEAAKRSWVRKYLRDHREPMERLMEYQEGERRRMQAAFEQQQRELVEQLCAELENPECSDYSSSSSSNSSTTSSATTSRTITITSPRNCHELDGFLAANDAASSVARKRLFSPQLTSLGYESEPQLLGETSSVPSTPRSLPLRNSSLTNSRQQAATGAVAVATKSATGRRFQTKVSSPTKTSPRGTAGAAAGSGTVVARSTNGSATGRRFQTKVSSPTKTSPRGTAGAAAGSGTFVARRKNVTSMGSSTNGSKKALQAKFVATPNQKRGVAKNNPDIPQGQGQRKIQIQGNHQETREWAATRINAAARGFLLRRLFKTEQVQRIVQTIRDTLIFVLNLHLETRGKDLDAEEPGNLRLKARLLQQLCSASRALHLIFFKTSTKERMEIISRDRMRKKLLALSPKHR